MGTRERDADTTVLVYYHLHYPDLRAWETTAFEA